MTRRTIRFFTLGTLAAAMVAFTPSALESQSVVELRMRGRYYAAPATVRITVAVEPDDANRTLRIEADGDRLFRSTEVALDGANSQRLHTFEFKNLPDGHYSVRAAVFSNRSIRGADESLVVVGDARILDEPR